MASRFSCTLRSQGVPLNIVPSIMTFREGQSETSRSQLYNPVYNAWSEFFGGRTCHFVGYPMRWLKWCYPSLRKYNRFFFVAIRHKNVSNFMPENPSFVYFERKSSFVLLSSHTGNGPRPPSYTNIHICSYAHSISLTSLYNVYPNFPHKYIMDTGV